MVIYDYVYMYVLYVVTSHYIRVYGSKPPRTRAKPRGRGWFTLLNSYVMDNK